MMVSSIPWIDFMGLLGGGLNGMIWSSGVAQTASNIFRDFTSFTSFRKKNKTKTIEHALQRPVRWNTSLNALYNHKPNGGEARQQKDAESVQRKVFAGLKWSEGLFDAHDIPWLSITWCDMVWSRSLQCLPARMCFPKSLRRHQRKGNAWCTRAILWICLTSRRWNG